MTPIRGPKYGTPEWLLLRSYDENRAEPVIISASNAAAVCGVSEHQTQLEFYLRFLGQLPPIEDNSKMRIGRKMESVILSEYGIQFDRDVSIDSCVFFHPELPFIAATPDCFGRKLMSDPWFPVDSKHTGSRRFRSAYGDEGTDEIPVDYLMQANCQMLVCDAARQETVVFVDGELKLFEIERSQELCDAIIDSFREMKERLINRDPPEPDYTHSSTVEIVKEIQKSGTGGVIDLPQDIVDAYVESKRLGSEIAKLDKEQKLLKSRVQYYMRDHSTGVFPGGTAEIVKREVTMPGGYRDGYSYYRFDQKKRGKSK